MKKRKQKLILVALVVMPIIGYLVYAGIRDMMPYYLTVSELMENGSQSSNGGVRVGGKVLEGSVSWDHNALKLRFTMGDDRKRLPVVYQGVIPDSFKQGRKVIIEGIYSDGLLRANQIMPKCASKFG
jgi:cytochrome c-type biogenesis protein CcmE